MSTQLYVKPEDMIPEVNEPSAVGDEQEAVPANAEALAEMNRKLDAILAALNIGEEQ